MKEVKINGIKYLISPRMLILINRYSNDPKALGYVKHVGEELEEIIEVKE
jgi:hypothetical protein